MSFIISYLLGTYLASVILWILISRFIIDRKIKDEIDTKLLIKYSFIDVAKGYLNIGIAVAIITVMVVLFKALT